MAEETPTQTQTTQDNAAQEQQTNQTQDQQTTQAQQEQTAQNQTQQQDQTQNNQQAQDQQTNQDQTQQQTNANQEQQTATNTATVETQATPSEVVELIKALKEAGAQINANVDIQVSSEDEEKIREMVEEKIQELQQKIEAELQQIKAQKGTIDEGDVKKVVEDVLKNESDLVVQALIKAINQQDPGIEVLGAKLLKLLYPDNCYPGQFCVELQQLKAQLEQMGQLVGIVEAGMGGMKHIMGGGMGQGGGQGQQGGAAPGCTLPDLCKKVQELEERLKRIEDMIEQARKQAEEQQQKTQTQQKTSTSTKKTTSTTTRKKKSSGGFFPPFPFFG